ncbi:heme-binding protein [Mycobacterium sp. C3-094]|uniref:heme-binding protein n=1 Tax=Mycobacterium sp. PSTR-4-N TaxID=2917745 RepID=UPI001F152CFE|nr:heme-binding protein [Mycobacterium sp. PSTR-4-N]MCG7594381.1 heme-binding protein [Mycobacterium sp. PSTR-4-N]
MSTLLTRAALAAIAPAAALLTVAVPASAQPAPPPPPNCTAADLAGVMAGVTASTSAYLFTHPDVNDFFTSLRGKSRDEMKTAVESYIAGRPDVGDSLRAIRQPSVDFRARCG